MTTHVAHDPFARGAYHRELSRDACAWCGRNGRTYRYAWESDGAYRCPIRSGDGTRRSFCNLECFRAYHGIAR